MEARELSNFVLNILSRSSMFSCTKAVTSDSVVNQTLKKTIYIEIANEGKN